MKEFIENYNLQNLQTAELYDFICNNDFSKEELKELLGAREYIDLVIPRGGEGLIKFVSEHSKIPVIKQDKGVCHIFAHL